MSRHELKPAGPAMRHWHERHGVIVVLTAFLLTVLFAFLALSVDTGRVVLTETRDAERRGRGVAGCLAGDSGGRLRGRPGRRLGHDRRQLDRGRRRPATWPPKWPRPTACTSTRTRTCSSASGSTTRSTGDWTVQWGGAPYNVVKVTARRNGADTSAPDGEFPLAFGWADRQGQRAARSFVHRLHRGPRPGAGARLCRPR